MSLCAHGAVRIQVLDRSCCFLCLDSVDPAGLNNPTAPWNIVNGAAGHYDGLDTLDSTPYYSVKAFDRYIYFVCPCLPGFFFLALPLGGAHENGSHSAYSWSRLMFHNCTHLMHEFVMSANGSILDSATLYKAHDFSSTVTDRKSVV